MYGFGPCAGSVPMGFQSARCLMICERSAYVGEAWLQATGFQFTSGVVVHIKGSFDECPVAVAAFKAIVVEPADLDRIHFHMCAQGVDRGTAYGVIAGSVDGRVRHLVMQWGIFFWF